VVIDQPNHALVLDGRPEQPIRLQQRHPQPFWRALQITWGPSEDE
jgi:hypothetical protein